MAAATQDRHCQIALIAMRRTFAVGLAMALLPAAAQQRTATVTVSTNDIIGSLDMGRMALGQGGLSEEPMWEIAPRRSVRYVPA